MGGNRTQCLVSFSSTCGGTEGSETWRGQLSELLPLKVRLLGMLGSIILVRFLPEKRAEDPLLDPEDVNSTVPWEVLNRLGMASPWCPPAFFHPHLLASRPYRVLAWLSIQAH